MKLAIYNSKTVSPSSILSRAELQGINYNRFDEVLNRAYRMTIVNNCRLRRALLQDATNSKLTLSHKYNSILRTLCRRDRVICCNLKMKAVWIMCRRTIMGIRTKEAMRHQPCLKFEQTTIY